MTAPAVYASYGTPDDFIELERNRVNVTGKVVIVRYGKCFRGLKAMNAQRRGAVGVIIYSDPKDDGYSIGRTYPDGPWRPKTSGKTRLQSTTQQCLDLASLASTHLSICLHKRMWRSFDITRVFSAKRKRAVLEFMWRRSKPCLEQAFCGGDMRV